MSTQLRNAASLVELCDALNTLWADDETDISNIDTTSLPTFGGEPIDGAFSWDAKCVLVPVCDVSDKWRADGEAWTIVPRDEYEA